MTVQGEAVQPATEQHGRGRGRARHPVSAPVSAAISPPVSIDDTTVGRRVRSGILLVLLVAVVGALSAAIISLLSYALLTGLRQMIG